MKHLHKLQSRGYTLKCGVLDKLNSSKTVKKGGREAREPRTDTERGRISMTGTRFWGIIQQGLCAIQTGRQQYVRKCLFSATFRPEIFLL